MAQITNTNFDSLDREQMKFLHYLHYRLAEKYVKKLSKDLAIKVELHTVLANQVSYEDYVNSQQEKIVQANYTLNNKGTIQVIFEWGLADKIINRLVGGSGEESDEKTFSDIELAILETQMETLIPVLSSQWKSVFSEEDVDMNFVCGEYQADRKLSRREAYIIFTFYLYFGEGELTRVVWAYPSVLIRQLLEQRQRQPNPLNTKIALNTNTLHNTTIDLKAVLGKTTLTMRELQSLQKDDVIQLETKLDEPLKIIIGKKDTLYGHPGIFNNHMSIQVTSEEPQDASTTLLKRVFKETETQKLAKEHALKTEQEDTIAEEPTREEEYTWTEMEMNNAEN